MKKLIWCPIMLITFSILGCNSKTQNSCGLFSSKLNKIDIQSVVDAVVRWQIDNYHTMDDGRIWKSDGDLSWENGVFHSALASWVQFTNNNEFGAWSDNIAHRNSYQLSTDNERHSLYYADDIIVGLMYASIYEKSGNKNVIKPTVDRLKLIAANPPVVELWSSINPQDRWSWSDALYMAPPVFARFAKLTCDTTLLSFLHSEYRATYDYLFDKDESLFYRDSTYFVKRENNGEKIFWGRGNAWVVGGLAQIIPYLDNNDLHKTFYIDLFKTMMCRIVKLQDRKTGYWHASLLDPESYPSPETSCSGFFTYALAWGINEGYLSKEEYMPALQKAWNAMVEAVHKNGMLGWVQPIGADPQTVTQEMTEVYGAAAMMLAGIELINLSFAS